MPDTPTRLLFVCSGNLCRSVMAEALTAYLAEQRDIPVEVASAGTLGLIDREPPPPTLAVMQERGIPVDHHRSQGVTAEHLAWADRVLVMTVEHATTLRERFAEQQGLPPIELLGAIGGESAEIADPMGRWRRFHRKTRDRIERAVERLLDQVERQHG